MDIIFNIVCAILSTISFSIFFDVPKKIIPYCSIIGTIGWVSYYILNKYLVGNAMSNFIAAVIIGLLAEFFSTKLKMPSTVFLYVGIVMIVPGYSLYKAMEFFANEQYFIALDSGITAVIHAVSIALGVLLSSIFSKSIRRVKNERLLRFNEIITINNKNNSDKNENVPTK